MNIGNKFHGNPSNSCGDISHKTSNVNLVVGPEEKSDSSTGNH